MKNPHKKKIIIIGPVYPYRGGNSLYVSYIYDSLHEEFDVKIFNYKLLYPSLLFPGTTQYDKSGTILKKAPSERIVNSINPLNWINVANRIKREKADLVVFDWWHPFFSACHFTISQLIKKQYKGKILFITENVVSHEEHGIEEFLTKIGLKNASRFLALSEIVEKDVKKFSDEKKIYRSELPVFDYKTETSGNQKKLKADLGYSENDKVLLFFGYVRKYKGLDILIKAFPIILNDIPEAKLLIVGEFYDDPNTYFDLVKKLKIEDKVKVVNKFIPNEEVGKYYIPSDLVILPYRSATQSGILNVAYGFNKPVLVTNVGGLAEFVDNGRTGLITDSSSAADICKGVNEFYKLRESVNFEANINEQIHKNLFNKLPELFHEILNDSNK